MPDDTYPRPPRANFALNRGEAAPDAEPRQPSSDPLAELARLIGQNDPFADSTLSRPERDLRDILSGRSVNGEWPADDERRDSESESDITLDSDQSSGPAPIVDRGFSGLDRAKIFGRSAPPVAPQDRGDAPTDTTGEVPGVDYAAETAGTYAASAPSAYGPVADYGGTAPDGPYYGDNGELSEHDPYARQDYAGEEPPASRRRSGVVIAAAVFGLAVVGTAGAYAYRTVFSHTGPSIPPLIKADASPNKVVPASQGGEGSKQIYDRIGDGGQGEKVVSREEQPVEIKDRAAGPRPGASGLPASALTASGWPLPPGTSGSQAAPTLMGPPAPAPSTSASEPRKVKTVTIRSDQGSGSEVVRSAPMVTHGAAADTAAVTASAPPVRTQPPRPAAAVPSASASGGAPLALTPRNGAQEDRPARTAALAPRATTGDHGGYVVQLSAQKTQGEASASFRALQAKYPNVLGGQQMLIRKKEVAGKGTFYGAQIGPFAERTEAVQLCEQLKSAGGSCIVQKN